MDTKVRDSEIHIWMHTSSILLRHERTHKGLSESSLHIKIRDFFGVLESTYGRPRGYLYFNVCQWKFTGAQRGPFGPPKRLIGY